MNDSVSKRLILGFWNRITGFQALSQLCQVITSTSQVVNEDRARELRRDTINDKNKEGMNGPSDDEGEEGEFFLDDEDIIQEIPVDEEDLPDAEDEAGSDADDFEEPDDSVHLFTGHTGELYTVACSPTDAKLAVTGGGDDRGFMWKIGEGDMALELPGVWLLILLPSVH
ncbi:uncharacterized WD repeat-containing protein C25H1.08c-like [Macadamia integrifolia]|uniref:uncharacterized WD repeat-containing protein C25H1.08c-like n=1 Tax=Macadamia integrifolia TaxID=60698 RepID=UPI001C4F48F7|nr:uncharacterized WD repeat-containing protein C25H1.08c-like [Macadamia integrifolia]